MTMVQATGGPTLVKSSPSPSGTKGENAAASSFASEIQSAIQQIQPVEETATKADSMPKDQAATDVLAQITEVLDALASLLEKPSADSNDQMAEMLAALQKVYELLQQIIENQEPASQAIPMDHTMRPLLQTMWPMLSGLSMETKADGQSVSDWEQKIAALLNTLKEKHPSALPKTLETKLGDVLDMVKNARKEMTAGQETVSFAQPEPSPLQTTVPGRAKAELMEAKPIGAGSIMAQEQPGAALEEGTTTQAMHHQSQGTFEEIWLGKTGTSSAPTIRHADQPLVPARFFANEMEVYIVRQVKMNQGNGAMETTLRLFPEHLGRVDVRITALNGSITAHFMASQTAGKEAIEQQMNQLRHALMQQGLHVEKIEVSYVTTTPGEQSNNNFLQQGKEDSREQQNRKEEQSSEETAEFNLEELIRAIESEAMQR